MSDPQGPAAAAPQRPAAAAPQRPAAAGQPSSTVLAAGLAEPDGCGVSPSATPNVGGPERGATAQPRRSPLWRLAVGALAVLAVLGGAVGVLYAFAGPEKVAESDVAAYEAAVPAEQQAEQPAVLSIPGCKCHSDDPVLRAEHARYRIRDCSGCHSGGAPIPGAR